MAIKLKGHETFALREGWLNKGLAKVDANPKVFSENYKLCTTNYKVKGTSHDGKKTFVR